MTNHPNRSKRARFIDNGRRVTLIYVDDMSGDQVSREFWIPNVTGSAYVREGDKQVCVGLYRLGNTLTVEPGQRLVDVIRQEYKSMRRDERADRARR